MPPYRELGDMFKTRKTLFVVDETAERALLAMMARQVEHS